MVDNLAIYMIIAFLSGGAIAILTNIISSFFTRKSFTNEPLFYKEPKPEVEEEIEEETDEQRYAREAKEFNSLKGQL